MREKVRGYVATTHRDSRGHKFTKEDLKQMLDQIRKRTQPIFRQHRINEPPVGKIIDAKLEKLKDGEYGILAIVEFYDRKTLQEIDCGTLKGFSVAVGFVQTQNYKRKGARYD